MDELEEKIENEVKRIIEKETKFGRFSVLNENTARLIVRIIKGEIMVGNIDPCKFRASEEVVSRKTADLVFIAAPTGAGKDTLVLKIKHDNADKSYVVLNMDKFRHYYKAFNDSISESYPEGLKDRDFALQTNEFSYEIYYTIQEILLQNFPGTNIMITGTIHEIDWVEDTFKRFKENPYTNYTNKLLALAVPQKVCAFSAIKRYLASIVVSDPGTARFVNSNYYNKTINNFISNFGYFEKKLLPEEGDTRSLIDVIEVYKRSKVQTDFKEDTLLYSSEKHGKRHPVLIGQDMVNKVMTRPIYFTDMEIAELLDKIELFKDYLIEQGLYEELISMVKELEPAKENLVQECQMVSEKKGISQYDD